jgi:hypothetical protein
VFNITIRSFHDYIFTHWIVIPPNKICYRCTHVYGFDYQLSQSCGYPLNQDALNLRKEEDNKKLNEISNKLALTTFKGEINQAVLTSNALANERRAQTGGELRKVRWSKLEQLNY